MPPPESGLVYVVEDDPGMRESLICLLHSAGYAAEGFSSAEGFLAGFRNDSAICLLVDVRLPGMDGIALHRHLLAMGAEPAVIMITGHGDIPMAVAALKGGAIDFVGKPFDPAVLLESVQEAVLRAAEVGKRKQAARTVESRLAALTPREAAILALLVEGEPSKVIAAELGISIRTVEHHRASIMEKAGVRTLSRLIRLVLEVNISPPE